MEVNITPTTDNKTRKMMRNTAEWKRNQQKKIRLVLYNNIENSHKKICILNLFIFICKPGHGNYYNYYH